MTQPNLVLVNKLVPSLINISQPKVNLNGLGKTAYVTYNGGRINLAKLDCRFPFGASTKADPKEKKDNEPDKYSVQCEITKEEEAILEQLDEHVIELFMKNKELSSSIGLKVVDRNSLVNAFTSTVKRSKDKNGNVQDQYPANIRVQFTNSRDDPTRFSCEFYRATPDKKTLPATVTSDKNDDHFIGNFIRPRSEGSMLFSLSIWMSAGKFGWTFRANQVKIQPTATIAKGVCLLDALTGGDSAPSNQLDDPDFGDAEEKLDQPKSAEEEEEELEDDSEEETPPPKPATKPAAKLATKSATKPVVAPVESDEEELEEEEVEPPKVTKPAAKVSAKVSKKSA